MKIYIIILLVLLVLSLVIGVLKVPKIRQIPELKFEQLGGSNQPRQKSTLTLVQNATKLDTVRNTHSILLDTVFQSAGILHTWKYNALKPGLVHFQIYRPTAKEDNFVLVGENIHQVTNLGQQEFKVNASDQIVFNKGDLIGLRHPDLGIIGYADGNSHHSRINSGETKGIGISMNFPVLSTNRYALFGEFIPRNEINRNAIGGNEQATAKDAQQIFDVYKKNNLGVPLDGTYWIKSAHMRQPQQIYCNFSLRSGHGYMLIGSVAAKEQWPSFDTGSYPFSPSFKYGKYDPHGRMGTFYLNWDQLDPSAVIDNDPYRCNQGKLQYNNEGKFCAVKGNPNQRVRFKNGLTEIMFVTGNNKYWSVVDRRDIESPITGKSGGKQIKPVVTSGNFEGGCQKNMYMYRLARKSNNEDPWINMGNSHACDTDVMFWGESGNKGHSKWMSRNGGVQIYVGGRADSLAKKSDHPYNPSHHMAPGKGRYASSYAEAKQICKAKGKKVCSVKQLTSANMDGRGYGKCACGWTSTKQDKYRYVVGYPTNIDKWSNLQGSKRTSGWCGKPGFNKCGAARPDKGIWGRSGADVYCCDPFRISKSMKQLPVPYNQVQLWLTGAEQLFERMYDIEIPDGAKFIVFATNDSGVGVAVHKHENKYRLASYSKGKLVSNTDKKALIESGVIKMEGAGDVKLYLLSDLSQVGLKKNILWPMNARQIVRYGGTVTLKNPTTNTELKVDGDVGQWKIRSERGSGGKRDSEPIVNGSVIRLIDVSTRKNLNSDGNVIKLFEVGRKGNSNDYWKIETDGSRYLYTNSVVRLVHLNTGRLAGVTNNKVIASMSRDDKSQWQINLGVSKMPRITNSKCQNYLLELQEINLKLQSGNSKSSSLLKRRKHLQRAYNTQCRKMSQNAFDKGLRNKVKKVKSDRKQLKQLEDQFDRVNKNYMGIKGRYDTQTNIYQKRHQELAKLRTNACKPVRKCLNSPYPGETKVDVEKRCAGVLKSVAPGGKITDTLIDSIQKSQHRASHVNSFDIRQHPEFDKYVALTDIQQCQK